MAFTNNVMIVRHKLLENLVALWKEKQLIEKIDRIPLEFSPRRSQPVGRCCIHKERAVTKYKSLPLLGWDMSDETDELTPLSTRQTNLHRCLNMHARHSKDTEKSRKTFFAS